MELNTLQFGEELFATVGATKHGHNVLNIHNVFWKIARREDEVTEKKTAEKWCGT